MVACDVRIAGLTGRLFAALAVTLLAGRASCGYVPPAKFLIISNARNGRIGYVQLPRAGGNCSEVRTLIDKDLVHPQGLAVDQKRQLLLVADSELRKVVSYGLILHEDGSLGVDEQTPLAEDVEARWVAVDGPGNVYLTDEMAGTVVKVTARQILDGDTSVKPVFGRDSHTGAFTNALSAPGGVATDNFHVYWTNKLDGQTLGTVVKALERPPNTSSAPVQSTALAKNVAKAYGVCLALDSVYFTDSERNVYAVKAAGGDVVTVSSQLSSPRGCAWDGESMVYIADRSADAIFAVPSMVSLAASSAVKVCHFEGAFGVAIFSSAHTRWHKSAAVWAMFGAMATSAFANT